MTFHLSPKWKPFTQPPFSPPTCKRRVPPTGTPNNARTRAFLNAYQAVRPLTAAEHALLPAMLRAGALRFWLSRLWDFHLPREAAVLTAHDPTHFERVLLGRLTSVQLLMA